MLVLSIGVRPAARQLGIPEPTVQAWAARGNWLDALQPQPRHLAERATVNATNAAALSGTLQPHATKPADALINAILDQEKETRSALSRAALNGARKAELVPVETAQDALAMGKLAALVHRWDNNEKPSVVLNLAFFDGDVS